MKKFKNLLLYGFIGFFITYLLGSFYSVSFDISIWSTETRFIVCFISGIVLFFTGVILDEKENND